MLTIHELLEDKKYRAYFQTVPKLKNGKTGKPWRLYVQGHDHKWRKKDFAKYSDAFKLFRKLLRKGEVRDAAINCRRQSFAPPTRMARIRNKYVTGSDGVRRQATKRVEWRPKLGPDHFEEHLWCPWCRRPSAFKNFSYHHAFPREMGLDTSVARCSICGASTRIIDYIKEV